MHRFEHVNLGPIDLALTRIAITGYRRKLQRARRIIVD
jgi:hypothetical protein